MACVGSFSSFWPSYPRLAEGRRFGCQVTMQAGLLAVTSPVVGIARGGAASNFQSLGGASGDGCFSFPGAGSILPPARPFSLPCHPVLGPAASGQPIRRERSQQALANGQPAFAGNAKPLGEKQ